MAAVQALVPAPAAYPSPATSLSTPMTAASWGAGALHQRLNAFVKKSLIQQLVPNGAVVSSSLYLSLDYFIYVV